MIKFARIIALSKLATIHADDQKVKESQNEPICSQVLAKPQVPNDSNSFGTYQLGHFSVDIWTIHDESLTYSNHLEEEQIQEVSGGEEEDSPFWKKFMINANVGETKVLIMPHNGRYTKKSKKENPVSHYVAFEIKLLKISALNQTEKVSKAKNNSKNIEHEGMYI